MADFQTAVELTLEHEGGYFHNQVTGEIVNFGITAKFLANLALPSSEADVQALTRDRAIELYRQYFWDANRLAEISDQALANKVFDLAVNMGRESDVHTGIEAVILLQRALNTTASLGFIGGVSGQFAALTVDGVMGPKTLELANRFYPPAILARLRNLAAERYREIAAADPHKASELDGWLKRLAA